ncbi:LysR family transcriptional regulator [Pseudomonas sp. VI4.1]|uniref:LysR family transcriptional regulator n=1 Tax=Pseudomonas sp. VI4.1 TaxID=1941346 RepID=UPI003531C5AD
MKRRGTFCSDTPPCERKGTVNPDNLTHGAVSRQIAILEDWLGLPLFVRDGQSMVAAL